MGFEYRSARTVAGLPLVHVAFGLDPYTGEQRIARGVIAVGQVSFGVVAVGQIAVGMLAFGQIAAGLCGAGGQIALGVYAAGQLAVGAAFAAGQFAAAKNVVAQIGWSGGMAHLGLLAAWVVAAGVICRYGWRPRKRMATLVDADMPFRLKDARPGRVTVAGKVVAIDMLESPVSRRSCVGWEVPRGLAGERACADFWVEDPSGRARVIAGDGVELYLEPAVHQVAQTRVSALVPMAQGVGSGSSTSAVASLAPVRHGIGGERLLLAGDYVVVSGVAMKSIENDSPTAPSASRTSRTKLFLHSGFGGKVMVTNRFVEDLRAEVSVPLWLAAAMTVGAMLLAMM